MECVPFDNKVEGNRHTRRRKKTRFYFITSFVFSNFSLLCVCLLLCSDYVDKYGSSTDTNTFTFNVHDVHVNCNVFHRTTQNGANIRWTQPLRELEDVKEEEEEEERGKKEHVVYSKTHKSIHFAIFPIVYGSTESSLRQYTNRIRWEDSFEPEKVVGQLNFEQTKHITILWKLCMRIILSLSHSLSLSLSLTLTHTHCLLMAGSMVVHNGVELGKNVAFSGCFPNCFFFFHFHHSNLWIFAPSIRYSLIVTHQLEVMNRVRFFLSVALRSLL